MTILLISRLTFPLLLSFPKFVIFSYVLQQKKSSVLVKWFHQINRKKKKKHFHNVNCTKWILGTSMEVVGCCVAPKTRFSRCQMSVLKIAIKKTKLVESIFKVFAKFMSQLTFFSKFFNHYSLSHRVFKFLKCFSNSSQYSHE